MPKFINYNFVEFSANVVMFVPMGLFASAYFKKARVGIFVGTLGSCLIELAQALLLPERFASGLDVLANTMGAALGALIYVLMVRRSARMLPVFLSAAPDSPLPSRAVHSTSKVAK
ncbi:hypothetical protein ART_4042 [Arthrobacter sp. PAMC 25486]|nr:hypothetical protein ART_4042 [Arthrobacter sp. PAMC 25486]